MSSTTRPTSDFQCSSSKTPVAPEEVRFFNSFIYTRARWQRVGANSTRHGCPQELKGLQNPAPGSVTINRNRGTLRFPVHFEIKPRRQGMTAHSSRRETAVWSRYQFYTHSDFYLLLAAVLGECVRCVKYTRMTMCQNVL